MSKTTRRVPPSSAKPTGERNRRREELVKGAPAAQGMFSLSVTDSHAAHLPLSMHRPRVGRLKATSKKRQVRSRELRASIIDPMTGGCRIESEVCCQGAAARSTRRAKGRGKRT